MIPKSENRFSDKIMPRTNGMMKWRFSVIMRWHDRHQVSDQIMAMNMAGSSGGGGRRGSRRKAVMAEINVTPMVDVMLVLLIIFMVSAPLLTVGVPLDLPQTQAKSLEQDKTPLQLSVDIKGKIFINDTEVAMDELVPKLKAITEARGGMEERIYMRADKKADYGTVAKVMGQLSGAGFKRLALVTEVEQGS